MVLNGQDETESRLDIPPRLDVWNRSVPEGRLAFAMVVIQDKSHEVNNDPSHRLAWQWVLFGHIGEAYLTPVAEGEVDADLSDMVVTGYLGIGEDAEGLSVLDAARKVLDTLATHADRG